MLDFIYNPKKRKEIEHILSSRRPSHNMRCYMVGYLHHACGLSAKDIRHIIETKSNWGDYSPEETTRQINSLCKDNTLGECLSSFSNNRNDKTPKNNYCYDNSIFSKLNRRFFRECMATCYEYSEGHYNIHGRMIWLPLKYPIYRSVEGRNHCLLVVDVDGDLEIGYDIAKHIYESDQWDFSKYSGNRGFHLIKKKPRCTKQNLLDDLRDIYQTHGTNLVSFTSDEDYKRSVNIDPCMSSLKRYIRGFCCHYSGRYSIPTDFSEPLEEILTISKDINLIKEHIAKYG